MPAVDQSLSAQAQLEDAARRLAHSDELETALSESGYRARKSASIRIRTTEGDGDVAQILAQRFCDIVADKSLREAGAFRRGDEVWIVLATPLAPPEHQDAAAAGRRVLDLINEARLHARRCGRKKFDATTRLRTAAALEHAARMHAQDMASHSLLGHKGSDESMPAERATQAGYSWASVAENVAGGQTTAEEVVDTWLGSPGHCANLMDPRYSETGVARAINPESEHVVYWVQVFAAPE
ncbi:MAG: CAP domain-containing protein [Woeseiaceae bacterium]